MSHLINGIILINKPKGLSSNAVLQRVRRHLNKPKAGHAGTLDPLATGMLPICVGHATKINCFLLEQSKFYTVTLGLGITTDTEDSEGQIIRRMEVPEISTFQLEQILQKHLGEQQQIPPQYSALKYQGKPMYEYARAGITINKPARKIVIFKIKLINLNGSQISFQVHCSKGTYVRSLVRDIGNEIGCGAVLTELHRNWTGPFELSEDNQRYKMLELENFLQLNPNEINQYLIPTDDAITNLPLIRISTSDGTKIKMGQAVPCDDQIPCGLIRMYDGDKQFMGVGTVEQGTLKPKRLMIDP